MLQLPNPATFSVHSSQQTTKPPQAQLNPLDFVTKLFHTPHDQLIEAALRLDFGPKQSNLRHSSKEHLLSQMAAYLATEEGKQ
ncbi:hypothetical protein FGO68_gene14070 [Halteria grandinella]|uniref:Uncharacterized protein n=1 Tax=Halteria grandinella TaxID=5974 RepID=A0A8J8NYY1_HALGN|nr:hypothetical protein FGO68_gene14070 [Halteria grandinella]